MRENSCFCFATKARKPQSHSCYGDNAKATPVVLKVSLAKAAPNNNIQHGTPKHFI